MTLDVDKARIANVTTGPDEREGIEITGEKGEMLTERIAKIIGAHVDISMAYAFDIAVEITELIEADRSSANTPRDR